jgi:hypothetical protein
MPDRCGPPHELRHVEVQTGEPALLPASRRVQLQHPANVEQYPADRHAGEASLPAFRSAGANDDMTAFVSAEAAINAPDPSSAAK